MNILLIDTVVPPSVFSGKSVRLFGIYGRLAKRHHVIFVRPAPQAGRKQCSDVEAWCSENFQDVLFLKPLPRAAFMDKLKGVLFRRPYYDLISKYPAHSKMIKAELLSIVNDKKIDAVITFSVEASSYGYLLKDELPWIQDLTDSMILQMRRRLKSAKAFKEKMNLILRLFRETAFEREMVEAAKVSLFVAEDDYNLYKDLRAEINANGVDIDYFDPQAVKAIEEEDPYLVFTGHMNFPPNVDAAVYFARSVLPRVRKMHPKLNFKVVGADPSEAVRSLSELPGVEVTGRVEDLRPYLAGAAAFVCPMRMGSGIKNKLLEAMAMNIPVVATKIALDGMQHIPEGLKPSAAEDEEFAHATAQVVMNRAINKGSYRDHVKKFYSWDTRVDEYDRCLDAVVGPRSVNP